MADEPEIENEELLLTEAVEPDEAPETPEAEEEEILTFGDTPEEEQETENGLIKHLREELKRARKEAAESRKPAKQAEPEELGPEPTIEDFEYDADAFREAHREWVRAEVRQETRKSQSSEAETAEVEATRKRIEKEKLELGRADVEDAFEAVRDTLTEQQQSLLVHTVDDGNTAKLIYALGKHPDRLAQLAGVSNVAKFIKEVAKLEGQLKVIKRKAPPEPDTPVSGSAKLSRTTNDKELERLEKEAERTKDRTKVIAHKRKLRIAGKL